MFLESIPTQKNTDTNTDAYSDTSFAQLPGLHSQTHPTSHQFISCHNNELVNNEDVHYEAPPSANLVEDPITKPARNAKHRDYFLDILKNKEDSQYDVTQELNMPKTDETDDDVNTFGDHVKCVLKKLSPRLKIQAKNDIFSILTKYETMNMAMQDEKQDNLVVKLEL